MWIKEWRAGFEPASPHKVLFFHLNYTSILYSTSNWRITKLSLKPILSLTIVGFYSEIF